MNLAIIYSKRSQECHRTLALMKYLEEPFVEYLLGKDFTQDQFESEFGEEAEYPQVAIGTEHVGGLKEALSYYQMRNRL